MLEIKDLTIKTKLDEGKNGIPKTILSNLNLTISKNTITLIEGKNGAGKSTLANVIMGSPLYSTTGQILFQGENIAELSPEQRAGLGIFLAFQAPFEIEGVSFLDFMHLAKNNLNSVDDLSDIYSIRNKLVDDAKKLNIPGFSPSRDLNLGFSGGEKKKSELLQLLILKPKLAILDEIDSGLDLNSLKIVADIVNGLKKDTTVIVISHNPSFYDLLDLDKKVSL